MIIELWALGLTKDKWLQEGMEVYLKRLPHLATFDYVELAGPKLPKRPTPTQTIAAEADYLLTKLKDSDRLYLFDEQGKSYNSRAFADFLEQVQLRGGSRIVLLIGGAFGFGESIYRRAHGSIRLSNMTFSHQLIRIMALEQLYRGYSILRGLPYHND